MQIHLSSDALDTIVKKAGAAERKEATKIWRALGFEPRGRISLEQFRTILKTEQASPKSTVALFEHCISRVWPDLKLDDLVDLRDPPHKIPDDPEILCSLRYSQFLSVGKGHTETHNYIKQWWKESTLFRSTEAPAGVPKGTLCFTGLGKNNITLRPFLLSAQRVGTFLFTVTARHQYPTFCYQASFTKKHVITDDEGKVRKVTLGEDSTQQGREIDAIALTGSWIGIDRLGVSCHFQCAISNVDLSIEPLLGFINDHDVHEVCGSANIPTVMEDNKYPDDLSKGMELGELVRSPHATAESIEDGWRRWLEREEPRLTSEDKNSSW